MSQKLAVFDFDSTLMDGETIDLLAAAHGSGERVAQITRRAMEGGMSFNESLRLRVATLRGMTEASVQQVCDNLRYNKGAAELVAHLKGLGYKVVVFSGGFTQAVSAGQKVLGYDAHFSNVLHADCGVLSGEVGGEMMFSYSKGRMLEKLQNLLGIGASDTIAIGDGANDISMFERASTRVAFCAKEVLKKAANIVINEPDLMQVAGHLKA